MRTTLPVLGVVGATAMLLISSAARMDAARDARSASPQATPAQSATFLKNAHEGGQAEISLAKTMEDKTSNPQVKTLAQTIRRDHTAANAEIESLADKKGVTLPTEVSRDHQAKADRITKLSGPTMDKAYVDTMIADHRADIAEFEKHQKDADPDVAAWATKTLPTLRNHLKLAEDAQKALGGS